MKRAILALYRVRGPVYGVAAVILVGNLIVGSSLSSEGIRQVRAVMVLAAFIAFVTCVLLAFLAPRLLPVAPTRTVHAPVRGGWIALNSPATRVPSHGLRAYGQAYAIDLAYEPAEHTRPAFGGEPMRAAQEYPGLGQPVLAMIDGTVVKASDWRRDHRARSNLLGVVYLLVEAAIRELGGPGFVIGNQVTIRGDDGVYATVAHLQRGSLTVGVGERVTAGQRIGNCGNSGNSTEPHVHAQLMDRASLWTGQGVPMAFRAISLDDQPEPIDGLPRNNQHMTAI